MTLEELVKELVRANEHWDIQAAAAEADVGGVRNIQRTAMEIVDRLLSKPGGFIVIQDKALREKAQSVIDQIWRDEIQTDEELWRKVIFGIETDDDTFNEGIGTVMADGYARRARHLKPTVIPKDLPIEVSSYLDESMAAWLHGLNCAALILSWTVVENVIKDALLKRDSALVSVQDRNSRSGFREKKATELISTAVGINLLTQEEANCAHGIRNLRNSAAHEGQEISSELSLDAIIQTKRLVERLLSDA
jgi:hypothetical protein